MAFNIFDPKQGLNTQGIQAPYNPNTPSIRKKNLPSTGILSRISQPMMD